jgi:ACS family glucarate transporter-like MFS transporter
MDPENTRTYRAGVVALLTAGTFINSVDRASLSVAVPFIIEEFKVDTATMGIALSAFFWTYVLGNLPAGYLADRFGPKAVLGWSAAVWSLFSALTGLAHNVVQVVLARLGVGLGEAGAFPCNSKIVASNFPSSERGTAIGIYSAGVRLGMAATPLLMAYLIHQWGWRSAFLITGIGSMSWCAFWYFGFKDLSRTKPSDGARRPVTKIPWKNVLTDRAILGIIMVKCTQDFLQWMFLTWVPAYLVLERGFSIIKMGIYGSLPWIAGFLAQPIIGYFSDWLIKQGWTVNRARKTVQVGLQILSSTIIIVGFVDDVMVAMFFLILSIAAESTAAGHIWVIMAEVIPPKLFGSVSGLVNSAGAIAGIVSPILTGLIVKATGSFQLALAIGGCSILSAAVFILFVVPRLQPLHLGDEPPPAGAVSQTAAG